jgi:single-strand DNA-binding protein
MSVNKHILLGRLGADPETKYLPSGSAVCNFRIATTETWTRDGQKHEQTEWHRITAYGKLAELAGQYLKKGREVYIEGSSHTRVWEDKDGVKRESVEVKAQEIRFIGGGQNDRQDAPPSKPWQTSGQAPGGAQRGAQGQGRGNPADDLDLDSVPF